MRIQIKTPLLITLFCKPHCPKLKMNDNYRAIHMSLPFLCTPHAKCTTLFKIETIE